MPAAARPAQQPSKRAKRNAADFEISSVSSASDLSDAGDIPDHPDSNGLDSRETPEQMRMRLAKELLREVESRAGPGDSERSPEEEEASRVEGLDSVTMQLHHDMLENQGKLKREAARPLSKALEKGQPVERVSGQGKHRLSTTCICIQEDELVAYSGSKDGGLAAWDVTTGARSWSARTHDPCLSVAVSQDAKLLASTGGDQVLVWDIRSPPTQPVRTLTGHRDVVSCLAFRLASHVLLSGSNDRSVRVWNAAEGSFIETLFGHQSNITGVDCLARERAVTCSEDLSVRLWKIPEESHLLLSGKHYASIDAVKMLDEMTFFSGSQDGSVALWHSSKRKPACVITNAHGPGHWIQSVAAVRNADLVASGSDDGLVRLWSVDLQGLSVNPEPVAALPVVGNVNALAFGQKTGRVLAVGFGQEHRLGRWKKHSEAKNSVCFFQLPHVN